MTVQVPLPSSGGNSFTTIQPQNTGANGTAAVADSSTDTLTVNAVAGCMLTGNASTDTIQIDAVGCYHTPFWDDTEVHLTPEGGASGNKTLTANRLYAMRVLVAEKRTFTAISVIVTTAVAASTIRLGIANRTSTNSVGTLVVDGGTVDSSSTGMKTVTISTALDPGVYYLLLVADASGIAIIGGAPAGQVGASGRKLTTSTGHAVGAIFRAFTAGAFGDNTGQTFSAETNASIPMVGIR